MVVEVLYDVYVLDYFEVDVFVYFVYCGLCIVEEFVVMCVCEMG